MCSVSKLQEARTFFKIFIGGNVHPFLPLPPLMPPACHSRLSLTQLKEQLTLEQVDSMDRDYLIRLACRFNHSPHHIKLPVAGPVAGICAVFRV